MTQINLRFQLLFHGSVFLFFWRWCCIIWCWSGIGYFSFFGGVSLGLVFGLSSLSCWSSWCPLCFVIILFVDEVLLHRICLQNWCLVLSCLSCWCSIVSDVSCVAFVCGWVDSESNAVLRFIVVFDVEASSISGLEYFSLSFVSLLSVSFLFPCWCVNFLGILVVNSVVVLFVWESLVCEFVLSASPMSTTSLLMNSLSLLE